jgi:hypothetical protein
MPQRKEPCVRADLRATLMPLTRLELFLNDIGCYEMQRHIKG